MKVSYDKKKTSAISWTTKIIAVVDTIVNNRIFTSTSWKTFPNRDAKRHKVSAFEGFFFGTEERGLGTFVLWSSFSVGSLVLGFHLHDPRRIHQKSPINSKLLWMCLSDERYHGRTTNTKSKLEVIVSMSVPIANKPSRTLPASHSYNNRWS